MATSLEQQLDEIRESLRSLLKRIKLSKRNEGQPEGVATLNSAGVIPSTQIIVATVTESGRVELATIAETDTGTDATRAVTPDGLAGSIFGKRVIGVLVEAGNAQLAIGDALNGNFFRIPAIFNGWIIVAVAAQVWTAGTTGLTTVQLRNVTDGVDVLSTKLTIDSGEKDSLTAATAAVIDTAYDDVATGDQFTWDVDGVQTTAPYGLYCEITLEKI